MGRLTTFVRRSAAGAKVLLGLGALAQGAKVVYLSIDVWGNYDFISGKVPQIRESVAATAASVVTVLLSGTFFNVVTAAMLISGGIWMLVSGMRRGDQVRTERSVATSVPPESPVPSPSLAPRALSQRQREQRKLAATAYLTRLFNEGKALSESNADSELFRSWDTRTVGFVRAAYGEAEVTRYLNTSERPLYTVPEVIDWRLQKLAELGRRLEFTELREDFDPTRLTETS
jgi:hypothetical protein